RDWSSDVCSSDLLVADRLPRLSAIVGAVHDLAEPVAGLGGVDAIRVRRGALEVEDFHAREVRFADLPVLALFVRGEDERALARPDEDSYSAHVLLLAERIVYVHIAG